MRAFRLAAGLCFVLLFLLSPVVVSSQTLNISPYSTIYGPACPGGPAPAWDFPKCNVSDTLTIPAAPPAIRAVPWPALTAPVAIGNLAWRDWGTWFVEPWTKSGTGYMDHEPGVYLNSVGITYLDWKYDQCDGVWPATTTPDSLDCVRRTDQYDGPRNVNSVSPYSAFAPDLAGASWYFVDLQGRLGRIDPDGSVTTIVGYRTRAGITPYHSSASLSTAVLRAYNAERVGTFDTDFAAPVDLAMDPLDHNIIFVADMNNCRIAQVNIRTATVSTYAGQIGQCAIQDGTLTTARFNRPSTLTIADDGTIYVGESADPDPSAGYPGGAIRQISRNGTVSTVANTQGEQPLGMRLDSQGNLLYVQDDGQSLSRWNAATGTTQLLYTFIPASGGAPGDWLWLDVDRRGNVGPVDDVLIALAVNNGRPGILRLSAQPDGSYTCPANGSWSSCETTSGPSNGVLPAGRLGWCGGDCGGHYTWAIAISATEGRFVTNGFGSAGDVFMWRQFTPTSDPSTFSVYPTESSDPAEVCLFHGRDVYENGAPIDDTMLPSFVLSHGPRGHNRLGLPSFDEMAYWTDAQLANYIRGGMGSTAGRAAITGNDLADVMYYIRMMSIRGVTENITPPAQCP